MWDHERHKAALWLVATSQVVEYGTPNIPVVFFLVLSFVLDTYHQASAYPARLIEGWSEFMEG